MTVILAGMGTGAYETAFWCEIINALTIRANKDCQAKKKGHTSSWLMGGFPYQRLEQKLFSFDEIIIGFH